MRMKIRSKGLHIQVRVAALRRLAGDGEGRRMSHEAYIRAFVEIALEICLAAELLKTGTRLR
jgi:hypothetical protein